MTYDFYKWIIFEKKDIVKSNFFDISELHHMWRKHIFTWVCQSTVPWVGYVCVCVWMHVCVLCVCNIESECQ